MKKNVKKTKKTVIYEESPWGDDDPILGEAVEDFLPPPHVLKKAKVRYINEKDDLPLPLREEDISRLRKQAQKAGLSTQAFVVGIVHDYLNGHLTRL